MIKTASSIADTRFNQPGFPTCVCLVAVTTAIFCALFSAPITALGDPLRYRGGLRNSPDQRKLNARRLDAVVNSLRDKTGFLEMRFDEDGFLTLGDREKFIGGSAAARMLLSAAVDAPRAIDLEDHTHNSKVAFARAATPVAYVHYSSGKKIEVFPLEIDFSDLSKLRGDGEAIKAFDLGFIILHELGHAALGLSDSSGNGKGIGECEEYINRIRREMNLPERQTYIAQVYTTPSGPALGTIRLAELIFARATEKQGQTRIERFNLRWEAHKVGPVVENLARFAAKPRAAKTASATVAGQ